MMTIQEIYEKFDQIGCVTFSTVSDGRVESRIAHFFAYDEDGLYFRTMTVKPFYKQLKESGNVTVCGMYPNTEVMHNEQNLPSFHPGYTIRIGGDIRELSMEEMEKKAEHNRDFNVAVYDVKNIPQPGFLFFTVQRESTMILIMQKNTGIISWKERDFPMAVWKSCLPDLRSQINVSDVENVKQSVPLMPLFPVRRIGSWETAAMNAATAM